MNIQPFENPPKFWEPRLHPWWFRLARVLREQDLRRQRIVQVEVQGLHHVRSTLSQGGGVLLTPNHSFHFDTYCLLRAADQLRCPFYIMTAWQVFGMANRWERWTMQRSGCFSVNREGTDREAFRTAVEILEHRRQPLVIFPEGDIYHTNDRIMPFRDGAAAVALSAAKRASHPVACIPVGLKAWYASDPTRQLEATASELERRLWWHPSEHLTLRERIYRLAAGLLALKEYEYFGEARTGSVGDRIRGLTTFLLERQEARHGTPATGTEIPERVKELRRRIIPRLHAPDTGEFERRELRQDLDDLFFVTQLYSYPRNYVSAQPTLERLAETLDKLEEDVLGLPYPSVRGERQVVVRFGSPILVPRERTSRHAAAELTDQLEAHVQQLLDELNQQPPRREQSMLRRLA